MHFAICFWGLMRSLSYNIESITKNVFEPIEKMGHSYEVFVHTYNVSFEVNKNSDWKLLNPRHYMMEDQSSFDTTQNYSLYAVKGDPWRNELNSLKNLVRGLHSLYRLAEMVEKAHHHSATKYDGVVFVRPDVVYLNPLPIELLFQTSTQSPAAQPSYVPMYSNGTSSHSTDSFQQQQQRLKGALLPNTLFVPDFHRSCSGGEFNDRFAMGGIRVGLRYAKRFLYAQEYAKTKMLHSEKFLHDYFARFGNVTVIEVPFRFRRVRSSGLVKFRDTDIISPRTQLSLDQNGHQPFKTPWLVLKLFFYSHNVDDPANIYCSPNRRLDVMEVQKYLMNKYYTDIMTGGDRAGLHIDDYAYRIYGNRDPRKKAALALDPYNESVFDRNSNSQLRYKFHLIRYKVLAFVASWRIDNPRPVWAYAGF